MEPGVMMAAVLGTIDVERLSGSDRVRVLQARSRQLAHYAAQMYRDIAAVSEAIEEIDDDPEFAAEAAAAEIRAALRLTRRAADAELAFAMNLRDRLPQVWSALAAGRIDVRRARTLAHGTEHLSDDVASDVVDLVIDEAPGLTTGQLGARLRRLCIDAHPEDARQRFETAVEARRIVAEPTVDGTAHLLGLDLPPERVAAVTRRLDGLARSLRGATESRTMDQLRADVLLDLLEGTGDTRGAGGTVDIHVDLDTLSQLSEHPGELAGYGPVIADIARQVTERQTDSEWRYTVTHPVTGLPVHTGHTRRRPTASQQRAVAAANPNCVFPGCRMPARDCDLDHRVAWAEGGVTTVENLAPLCRHDHRIRHRAGWTHRPLAGGDHLWTTLLGLTYTTSGAPP